MGQMSDEDAQATFGAHIDLGAAKPGYLFVMPKITKQGLTSSWAKLKKYQGMLSAVLDKTAGQVPAQAGLTKQFDTFLKSHSMNWSLQDTEKSMYRLRSMLRSLKNIKLAPKGHECLGASIAKFSGDVDEPEVADTGGGHNDDDDDDDADTVIDAEEESDSIDKGIGCVDGPGDADESPRDDDDDDDAAGDLHPAAVPFRGFRFESDVQLPWNKPVQKPCKKKKKVKKKKTKKKPKQRSRQHQRPRQKRKRQRSRKHRS